MKERNYFEAIDVNSWPRSEIFYYYTKMAPTNYSVNVTMDVTKLRNFLKTNNIKFFPAYLYLVTKAVLKQREFCIAVKEGTLGYWNNLVPIYPKFYEEDKTTALLWTEYDSNFEVFYKNYLKDSELYSERRGILTTKGIPPANSFVVSCIPWFSFESFSLYTVGNSDYYFPSIEAGGFREAHGGTVMPLSITVNHGTVDGYHLKVFFEELQKMMNNPKKYLNV